MRTSYSALETYKTCPLKFKFQEIDRIKVPKSKEAIFGSLIHRTLKFFHSPRPLSPTLEQLLEYYRNNWPQESGCESEQEKQAIFAQGVKMLTDYYGKNSPTRFKVIDLETFFEVPIENHLLVGKIDRIDKLGDGSYEIIDYKTTKQMPSQAAVDNDFQLSLYRLGLEARWPQLEISRVKLSLYYLRHGEKLSTTRTKEQLEETKRHVISSIGEIEKGEFKPIPSPLCDWCGYKRYCPMFRHQFTISSQAVDDQQIKEIISEYFRLRSETQKNKRRLAELKGFINQYCDEKGLERVFGDEGFITRLPQKRYAYDFDKVREILEPLGRWDEVLAIDGVRLKKVAISLPYEARKKIFEARKVDKEYKMLVAKQEAAKPTRNETQN